MKLNEAITHMMERSRYNASRLSVALGKHRSFLSTSFSKGSVPRFDTFARMADVMGYRIVLESDGDRIEIDPPAKE